MCSSFFKYLFINDWFSLVFHPRVICFCKLPREKHRGTLLSDTPEVRQSNRVGGNLPGGCTGRYHSDVRMEVLKLLSYFNKFLYARSHSLATD